MKYLVRAIKYFFYYVILLGIVLAFLIVTKFVDADINVIFRNGYESLLEIGGMFACVAAVYPLFGFMKKGAVIPGEFAEIRDGIVSYMQERGYILESENGENMTFRMKNKVAACARMCEDRISFSREFAGYTLEGLRKDVIRLVYGLESRFRSEE